MGTTCLCFDGYNGGAPDCSLKECPTGVAWADKATHANQAHQVMECSNAGTCDRQTGKCRCSPGFYGNNCQRLKCPNNCNGNGVCRTVGDIHKHAGGVDYYDITTRFSGADILRADGTAAAFTSWEKDSVTMCDCAHGYSGFDCSQRLCPKGDDPLTTGQVTRKVLLTVQAATAMGGKVKIQFQNDATGSISLESDRRSDAHCKETMERSPKFQSLGCTVGGTDTDLTYQFSFDEWPLYSDENNLHSHMGNPPLSSFHCDVSEAIPADGVSCLFTDVAAENVIEHHYCSNRGLCDFETGLCRCFRGYGGVACGQETYDQFSTINYMPAHKVTVDGDDFSSTILQIGSERASSTAFNMLKLEANGEPVFFVRGDGSLNFFKLSIQSGGLMIASGGLTVQSDGMLIKNDGLKPTDAVLSASTYYTVDAATPPILVTTATTYTNTSFLVGAFNQKQRKFSVRNDGNTNFWTKGVSVTGGITVYSDGFKVSGGATILSEGMNIRGGGATITSGGMRATNGLSVVTGGLRVVHGGATIQTGALKVNQHGLTIGMDGMRVLAGGMTIAADGLVLTEGLTVFSGGLKVTGGITLLRTGFYSTGGLSIMDDGLVVTGSLTMPDVASMAINCAPRTDDYATDLELTMGTSSSGTAGRMLFVSGEGYHSSSGDIVVQTAGGGVDGGTSGDMTIQTGATETDVSGAIVIGTGMANSGRGGAIVIKPGESQGSTAGGDLLLKAGDLIGRTAAETTDESGSVFIMSGASAEAGSGNILIDTPAGGTEGGSSGMLVLSTGTSNTGNSGAIYIGTGTAVSGKGGAISITVGSGDTGDGGALTLKAGNTVDAGTTGGAVHIMSGYSALTESGNVVISTPDATEASGIIVLSTSVAVDGSSGGIYIGSGLAENGGDSDGGVGGAIAFTVGAADTTIGSMVFSAGTSGDSTGGKISIVSGLGELSSSGDIVIKTSNSEKSGLLSLSTGAADAADSGVIYIGSGSALSGRGGKISILVGTGDTGAGGDLTLSAGNADSASAGGLFSIASGISTEGTSALSGDVHVFPGESDIDDGGTVAIYPYSSATNPNVIVNDLIGVKFTDQDNGGFIQFQGETDSFNSIEISSGSNQIIQAGLTVTDGFTINTGGLDVTGESTLHSIVVTASGFDIVGGLKVTDGVTIDDGGMKTTGGMWVKADGMTTESMTVNTGGLKVTQVGAKVTGITVLADGMTISADGLQIDAGGINIGADGATVENGVTVATGGVTVTGGGVFTDGGVTVTAGAMTVADGTTVKNEGMTIVDSGLDVQSGGFTVDDSGIDVDGGGVTVTGGLAHDGAGLFNVLDTGIAVADGLSIGANGLFITGGLTIVDTGFACTGATCDGDRKIPAYYQHYSQPGHCMN